MMLPSCPILPILVPSPTDSEERRLHLSFTTWKVPLDYGNTGVIDQEIFLLEAVVSVQDKGKWVADFDVLSLEREPPDIISCSCERRTARRPEPLPNTDNILSIESWDEFLDPPPCIGVLHTHGNWVARLAASCALIQQGNGHTVVILRDGENNLCWKCLGREYSDPEPHLPQRIIL